MPVQYHTNDFPLAELEWARLIPLLGTVAAAIARYDGTLAAIPNAAVLLSPLTTQEAVLSSRIEETQATMGEVLELEAEGDSAGASVECKADIQEVLLFGVRGDARFRRYWESEGGEMPFDAHPIAVEGFLAHTMSKMSDKHVFRYPVSDKLREA